MDLIFFLMKAENSNTTDSMKLASGPRRNSLVLHVEALYIWATASLLTKTAPIVPHAETARTTITQSVASRTNNLKIDAASSAA